MFVCFIFTKSTWYIHCPLYWIRVSKNKLLKRRNNAPLDSAHVTHAGILQVSLVRLFDYIRPVELIVMPSCLASQELPMIVVARLEGED